MGHLPNPPCRGIHPRHAPNAPKTWPSKPEGTDELDHLGFYGDFMGFYGDLMDFYGDSMGYE